MSNWKEAAKKFYEEFTVEEIEEFINSKTVIKFVTPGRVIQHQRIENMAAKLYNEYYTAKLKEVLKTYNNN